jgi:hypothetical protein
VGCSGFTGEQKSAVRYAGADPPAQATPTNASIGIDLSGSVTPQIHWYAQGLWNEWSGLPRCEPGMSFKWFGGFAGVDYIPNDRWAFSALYNYAEANDLDGTGTIYEGINMNS